MGVDIVKRNLVKIAVVLLVLVSLLSLGAAKVEKPDDSLWKGPWDEIWSALEDLQGQADSLNETQDDLVSRVTAIEAAMCPPGLTFCNGKCVDTSTDENHCGACNNVCSAGEFCISGVCTPVGGAACGNEVCEGGENCNNCPDDCGECPGECGDGTCDPDQGEDCNTCPDDCGECPGECGDETCDPDQGEDCGNCPDDCGPCGDADDDGYTSDVDCDDEDPSINPGATEVCNGKDDNCDGNVDEGCAPVCGNGIIEGGEECDDGDTVDGDGCSASCTVEPGWSCEGQPSSCTYEDADDDGYTSDVDCDDNDASVNPGATELCDGQDNDCDGGIPATETDSDGDGYVECSIDAGGWDGLPIFGGDDCDDTDLEVNPAAAEACNGFDDDCDGEVDEGC